MLGAGLEPAFPFWERDFKSLASTHFAIRANFVSLTGRQTIIRADPENAAAT